MYKICEEHLGLQRDKFTYPDYIQTKDLDEMPLLLDILDGGTYGATDINRLHSATMTLKAVSADHAGSESNGLARSLFPSLSYMKKQYPYLKKYQILLPVAWTQRFIRYMFHSTKNVDPIKTVAIGIQRIEMLRQYGILK